MTDTTFAPLMEPIVEQGNGNRRALMVGGGVLAAALLAGGGYLLLAGSSSDDASATPVALAHHRLPVTKNAPGGTAKKPVVVPPVSSVPLGRDPFKALYVQPVTPPAAVTPVDTSTNTTTPPANNAPAAQPAPTTYKLVLTAVDANRTATFTVAGKLMSARVGYVFGPSAEIKLLSVGYTPKGVPMAVLQVGDGDPFDVNKGQTLYVQ